MALTKKDKEITFATIPHFFLIKRYGRNLDIIQTSGSTYL